jgi:hypothetical protein
MIKKLRVDLSVEIEIDTAYYDKGLTLHQMIEADIEADAGLFFGQATINEDSIRVTDLERPFCPRTYEEIQLEKRLKATEEILRNVISCEEIHEVYDPIYKYFISTGRTKTGKPKRKKAAKVSIEVEIPDTLEPVDVEKELKKSIDEHHCFFCGRNTKTENTTDCSICQLSKTNGALDGR